MKMYRKDSKFEYGAFKAEVRIEKLRWGGTDRERVGSVIVIPGVGVAKGMTAMQDCVDLDLAERGAWVKVDGKSIGYRLTQLIEEELDGNLEPFKVFNELLEEHYEGISTDTAGNGEDVPEPENGEGGEMGRKP
jgi:hypothetical protein